VQQVSDPSGKDGTRMHQRVLRTLLALAATGSMAGGSAAYAAVPHDHGHPARHAPLGAAATGMSGTTGSHHCPGM
jgi:hypothetical protein